VGKNVFSGGEGIGEKGREQCRYKQGNRGNFREDVGTGEEGKEEAGQAILDRASKCKGSHLTGRTLRTRVDLNQKRESMNFSSKGEGSYDISERWAPVSKSKKGGERCNYLLRSVALPIKNPGKQRSSTRNEWSSI